MEYYSSKKSPKVENEDEQIYSIKDFVFACLKYWKWFLASIIIMLGFGFFYGAKQEPVYRRTMMVLIQNHDAGGGTEISQQFDQIGFLSSKANVNNELLTMTTSYVVGEVVNRLKLNINYRKLGTFHPVTLYDKNNPVLAEFIDLGPEVNAGFKINLQPNQTVELYDFWISRNGKVEKYEKEIKTRLSFNPIVTPIGFIRIQPNGAFTGQLKEEMKMAISHAPYSSTVEKYQSGLKGELADKDADVIELSVENTSPQIATAFLDNIITVYNENWITDKNKISVATNQFIDERLQMIESELGNVDADLSRYKTDNLLPSVEVITNKEVQRDLEMDRNLLDLSTQLAMAKYMRDYILNPKNANKIVPANIGLKDVPINGQIEEYNKLLMQYQQLADNSGPNNPLALEYKTMISGLYESLCRSIETYVASLEHSVRQIENAQVGNTNELRSKPEKAKYLLSIERQQKVKEELYIYLLEKREENELSQAFTAYNTRIIQPPYGPQSPVAPKKGLILAICGFLALVVPGVIIYFIESTDTSVRSRRDLDGVMIPYSGEIPDVAPKSWYSIFKTRKAKLKETDKLKRVVYKGKRDLPNEAFRVVRSNLDFMMGKNLDHGQVLAITSFNPGSGKSFITFNLGSAFALKDKRVLLIDGDLRHGSLSSYVGNPQDGLSNYLSGHEDDWNKAIVSDKEIPGLYILPIGHRPPNPAELLESERLKVLIEKARKEYDIVLIDCPPVNIVVDTQRISEFVDRTIFVVRSGMLEKAVLEEIVQFYDSSKFNHLCLLLNGTKKYNSSYHYYGNYGSSYGYNG